MAIYKYVSEERIDVLENMHIRFTQPSMFNDPFEVNPYFTSLTDDIHVEKLLREGGWDEKNFEKLVSEKLLEKTKKRFGFSLPLSLIKPYIEGDMRQYLMAGKNMFRDILTLNTPRTRILVLSAIRNALDETIGILSLTEKPDNLIMWAHYANSHQGFIIELDEKHSFFDQRTKPGEIRGYLRKVQYEKERPQMMLYNSCLTDKENMKNMIDKLIWCKSHHWEYEQEWRMVEVLKGCPKIIKKAICLFPLPLQCIKGIIFGCRMIEENRERIIKLLQTDTEYSHINIYEAKIDEKDFKLNIAPFNF